MKWQALYKVLCIALLGGLLLTNVGTPQAKSGLGTRSFDDFVPGEVLVKFQPGVTPIRVDGGVETGVASLDALIRQYDITAAEPVFAGVGDSAQGLDRIYKLNLVTTADILAAAADLSADAHVEYAEPNYLFHIGALPDDPRFSDEWGLHNTGQTGGTEDADIDAPEAWDIITGTTDVLIAVTDTGVDYTHEDLDDGRVRTDMDKDYVNDDDDAMDDHGHGTHVAGTIAAEANNGLGVAGIMWQAEILPLKVLNSLGIGSSDDIAAAIRYAADQDADVINMSLGDFFCSQTIAEAVNYAYFDQGVVIVAAAGNSGSSISYPAKHPPVIAVGATDHDDERAYFSSYGDALDVVAPGVGIWSTVPGGYDTFSGTSMASPHVAGVVGLLLAQRPDLTPGQVREILRQSADDLGEAGFDRYYGYGRVNAYQALQMDTPDEPDPPEQAECPPGVCGASVAVAGEPDEESILSDLRAVRDHVFTQDPGQRWSRIYYEHQLQVAWLLASDSQLREDTLAGLRTFSPVFHALLEDNKTAPPVILTTEQIAAAERALMGVAKCGSQALHDDIVREWEKADPYRFVGWDVRAAWEQLRLEEQAKRIYLPTILKSSPD
jgi:subtilisin family serine protease